MGEKSVDELRAEIAASRERLAGTIDELTTRAAPKALVQRQSEAPRRRPAAAPPPPEGDLRPGPPPAAAGAVAVLMIVRYLVRRRGR